MKLKTKIFLTYLICFTGSFMLVVGALFYYIDKLYEKELDLNLSLLHEGLKNEIAVYLGEKGSEITYLAEHSKSV